MITYHVSYFATKYYRYWPHAFATLDDAHQALAEADPKAYGRLYWKLYASGKWAGYLSAGIEGRYRIERSDSDGMDV